MIKKGVIICGGWATRFLPTSKGVAKELLPLYDKPIIHWIVDDLVRNGITEILFVIRNGKEEIGQYFSRDVAFESNVSDYYLEKLNTYSKAHFYFTYQNFQLGTGSALLCAKEWIGDDTFILLNGDEIIDNSPSLIKQMLIKHSLCNGSVIALQKVKDEDISRYGIADIKDPKNGLINGIVEKPKIFDAPSNLSNIGTYIFDSKIFDCIHIAPSMPITDAINLYVKENNLYGAEIQGRRFDMGNPLGYVFSNFTYVLSKESTKEEVLSFLENLGFVKV